MLKQNPSKMKSILRCLIVLALTLSVSFAEAQVIGKESLVLKKNIFIGFKGGITALDMQYKNAEGHQFVNHSAIYQGIGNFKSCLTGSIYVERSLPRFSYGVELVFNTMNAKCRPGSEHYSLQDSAYFASVRIPVKIKFLEEDLFSPYLFVAPSIGTYVSDTVIGLCSTSVINGGLMTWGTKNASKINLNVLAGAGVEGKIQVGLYEFRARLEVCYNLGVLKMTPKKHYLDIDPPVDYPYGTRMRGWEATIGLAFPLFVNPSYSWLN